MDQDTQIIDNIIKSNRLKFLEFTKEDCTDQFYLNKINDLVIYFNNIDKKPKDLNIFESDIDQRLAKIDEYIFRKPWNKLTKIQKEIKLKEFISRYFICNNENTNNIKNLLLEDFNNDKLNSAKIVNYDSFKSDIIGISRLSYNIIINNIIMNKIY